MNKDPVTLGQAEIDYIAGFGPKCRDCADDGPVCPATGIACSGHKAAAEHAVSALNYGWEHGFLAAPSPPEPAAGGVSVKPVSDDAIRHLAIRSPLNNAIYGAIRGYLLSNMADEDGAGYPLVDLMSNEPPATIATGEMEMITLADDIEIAVRAALEPAPSVADMAVDIVRLREALKVALPRLEENARFLRDMQAHAGVVNEAFEAVNAALAALKGATHD